MRLGFILGFLLGGGIASLLGKTTTVDTPVIEGEAPARANPIKQHVDEAKDAAMEARLEKEAEMLRLYDDLVHRKSDSGS